MVKQKSKLTNFRKILCRFSSRKYCTLHIRNNAIHIYVPLEDTVVLIGLKKIAVQRVSNYSLENLQ